jgi:hypothetical protein
MSWLSWSRSLTTTPLARTLKGDPVWLERPWHRYLEELFVRTGGFSAPTNAELATVVGVNAKPLAQGVASAVLTTIYTVPTSTVTLLTALTVCNPTTGSTVVNLTVKLVQATGVDGGTLRTAVPLRPLLPGRSDGCPEVVGQALKSGGLVQIQGAGLEWFLTGTETKTA